MPLRPPRSTVIVSASSAVQPHGSARVSASRIGPIGTYADVTGAADAGGDGWLVAGRAATTRATAALLHRRRRARTLAGVPEPDARLDSSTPVAVVTGANSGIGRATALHLAQSGYRVFGTVRSLDRADKLLAGAAQAGVEVELVELDVASDDSVRRGFAAIFERAGRVDHLVNNAGVGGNGVVEEASPQRLLEVFDVDVCGGVRCIQQVLPGMRTRGHGTIVNVTSVAGRIAAVAQAPYVAAKWAFEGLSEQLAQEVIGFGVRVAIVEPGVTKSSIFGKNTDAPNESGVYAEHYARMLQMYAAGYLHATDAVEVARVIRHAIETDQPRLRYQVSWGGRELVEGRQAISDEAWVELGRPMPLPDYIAAFRDTFGLDFTT
jgi:NAD(P)-dependent dehydrogenase (short-subunit alcohol dehydrogenase family)